MLVIWDFPPIPSPTRCNVTGMPELPEVETMRRGIRSIVGATITRFRRLPCKLQPLEVTPSGAAFGRRVKGKTIRAVERLGKRVVVRLETDEAIVLEPRMTGLVLVADPPNREHLRVEFELDREPGRLWYWDRRGLGSVRLFTADELAAKLGPPNLGPDALAISLEELRSLRSSRRAIKAALLDQRAVAGIGNIYASEMLHLARIHPAAPCDQIPSVAWKRLHAAMLEVLGEAIRYEGSTLGDGTYRNALNKEGGYQNHHRVYARSNEVCVSCGRGTIQRTVLQQRATFHCNRCQKLPRKRTTRLR